MQPYNFINKTFSVDPEYSLVSDVQFVFMDQYVFTFFILGVSLAIFGAVKSLL